MRIRYAVSMSLAARTSIGGTVARVGVDSDSLGLDCVGPGVDLSDRPLTGLTVRGAVGARRTLIRRRRSN